jgi:hypothetical protein
VVASAFILLLFSALGLAYGSMSSRVCVGRASVVPSALRLGFIVVQSIGAVVLRSQ